MRWSTTANAPRDVPVSTAPPGPAIAIALIDDA